ncbi:MAG: tRNA lysidine(34) synthetase TilS [Bifidobacteriaceae bacterium]|nr:tRNA lysidine(34) synthetase TilS [Bifidobacteriaceae bacterium]
MVYTAQLRKAVGCVKSSLLNAGFSVNKLFKQHGHHEIAQDAPLVLVACSGGRDSLALAAVSQIVCSSMGLRCGAIIVDHGLQEDSYKVAVQAQKQCEKLGLNPVKIASVRLEQEAMRRQGVEAAAREARYKAIEEYYNHEQAQALLLAHTKNDQAETVLMGLLRSSGVESVAGMSKISNMSTMLLLRPLLDVTREETTQICKDLSLTWWDDPTNGEDKRLNDTMQEYPLRSRVRAQLIPYVQQFFSADVVSHIAHSAAIMQDDVDYLHEQTIPAFQQSVSLINDNCVEISIQDLKNYHVAIRRRVIVQACNLLQLEISSKHIAAIDEFISNWHGQGSVKLPSKFTANHMEFVIRICKDSVYANR